MNKSIENHDYFANFKYYSDQTQVLKNYWRESHVELKIACVRRFIK